MAENWRRKTLFLALMGIFCCGLGFLTKGFLAFAVPVLTVAPFLVWEGRYKDLLRIPWIPMITAFVIVLPWSLMIHFREGDFWNYFFWTEHVARFVNPIRGTASQAPLVFFTHSDGWRPAMGYSEPGCTPRDFQIRNEKSAHPVCRMLVPFPFSLLLHLQRQADPVYPAMFSAPGNRFCHRSCGLL